MTPKLCVTSDTNGPSPEADLYAPHASGLDVFTRRTNALEHRKTVSTRADGCISIKCHKGENRLEVRIK